MLPTPDGLRYLHLNDQPVPRPFHLRWLVPYVCRREPRRWAWAAWVSWVVATVGVGLLAPTWQTGMAAALMFCWLPGIRYNLARPILVDLPAMALALVAAVLAKHGQTELAILVSATSGACKESGPVFAAAYAWNPWLLVGLVAPLGRALVTRAGTVDDDPLHLYRTALTHEEHDWITTHPWRAGLSREWMSPQMVAPWGAAVVAVSSMTWQLGACLALAYGQLLRTTDTVRLYQWAAPVVCIAAATAVPVAWLPVLVVLTVWNPLAGDGV